ncbi:hypothetical protein HD806DRAFT_526993 [Xylariaceae sp. AK1471]|nr:hypothetical protein HD806DRAFT_526993 [Xylariaceae sp. AK1471]
MAIIQGLPGLEVTIFTDGSTAKEYDDPSGTDEVHRRPQVVTKYIECKDNEPFRIHLKATKKYSWGYENHALNFAAVIDGIWAKGELCSQKDTKDEAWERDISYRVVTNPNEPARYVFQEFAFSTLIKVDWTTDEQRESDMERMERLGTIEVKVYRTIVQGNGPTFVPAGEHPEDFIVSQEATRGKSQSHGTKFTCTQPATKPNYVKCSSISEDNGPIAIFRFKYRSRAALRLEGITPDPHTASDWLVEIPDDEKDEVNPGISRRNQRNSLNNSNETMKKTKKEEQEEKYTVDILAPPSPCHDIKRSHNSNSARLSRPEHSIFPDFQLPSPSFQKSMSHQKNAEAKTPEESMIERCRRIINQEAERIVDDQEREKFADRRARLSATPRRSVARSVTGSTNFDAFIRAQLEREEQVSEVPARY